MTTPNTNPGSAKIYQFPVGGRAALTPRDAKPATDVAAARVGKAVSSSSWYHEAAVSEDLAHKPQ